MLLIAFILSYTLSKNFQCYPHIFRALISLVCFYDQKFIYSSGPILKFGRRSKSAIFSEVSIGSLISHAVNKQNIS